MLRRGRLCSQTQDSDPWFIGIIFVFFIRRNFQYFNGILFLKLLFKIDWTQIFILMNKCVRVFHTEAKVNNFLFCALFSFTLDSFI